MSFGTDSILSEYKCFVSQAGIIEEMIEDSFESLEEDDLEEAAQEEVDKILWEVTSGKIV